MHGCVSRMKQSNLLVQQQGVALLEVLISIIIIAIGLLGIAALQSTTMRQGHHSELTYQALLQIYDMADRMRANPIGLTNGLYNNVTGIPNSPPVCSGPVNCTPAQMATADIAAWNNANAILLPTGTGTVTGAGSGTLFTVTINWVETEVGNRSLSMGFQL